MARRQILSLSERESLLALPDDELGVRLENGKYPTLSLFFKQAYAVALMPIQSGPCDRRLIHFMK